MKEVNKIRNILSIASNENVIAAFCLTNEIKLNLNELLFIEVTNLYSFKATNYNIIYQERKGEDVFILGSDNKIRPFYGKYSILNALNFKSGYIITSLEKKSFCFVSPKIEYCMDLEYYLKISGQINNELVYDRKGDELKIYSLKKKALIKTISLSQDEEIYITDQIYCLRDSLFIILSSGRIISYDLNNFKENWVLDRIGRIYIYKGFIYSIADQTIREIDALTGVILREKSIKDLETKYHFFPTGEHKVYDEYIFIMAAGKPGQVALYDRISLNFIQMIEVQELIPIGQNNLHWFNNNLYILDFGNTLHVYNDKESKKA